MPIDDTRVEQIKRLFQNDTGVSFSRKPEHILEGAIEQARYVEQVKETEDIADDTVPLAAFRWFPHIPTPTPTTVLLHGLDSSKATWNAVVSHLSQKGYPALALDLRGHGESPMGDTARYNAQSFADDVLSAVEAHGVPKPFVLVGHSMGGRVAMEIAARDADRILAGQSPRLAACVIVDMDIRVWKDDQFKIKKSAEEFKEWGPLEARRCDSWEECRDKLTSSGYGEHNIARWTKDGRIRRQLVEQKGAAGEKVETKETWWTDINPYANKLTTDGVMASGDGANAWRRLGEAREKLSFSMHLWLAGNKNANLCKDDGLGGTNEMMETLRATNKVVFADAYHSIHSSKEDEFMGKLVGVIDECARKLEESPRKVELPDRKLYLVRNAADLLECMVQEEKTRETVEEFLQQLMVGNFESFEWSRKWKKKKYTQRVYILYFIVLPLCKCLLDVIRESSLPPGAAVKTGEFPWEKKQKNTLVVGSINCRIWSDDKLHIFAPLLGLRWTHDPTSTTSTMTTPLMLTVNNGDLGFWTDDGEIDVKAFLTFIASQPAVAENSVVEHERKFYRARRLNMHDPKLRLTVEDRVRILEVSVQTQKLPVEKCYVGGYEKDSVFLDAAKDDREIPPNLKFKTHTGETVNLQALSRADELRFEREAVEGCDPSDIVVSAGGHVVGVSLSSSSFTFRPLRNKDDHWDYLSGARPLAMTLELGNFEPYNLRPVRIELIPQTCCRFSTRRTRRTRCDFILTNDENALNMSIVGGPLSIVEMQRSDTGLVHEFSQNMSYMQDGKIKDLQRENVANVPFASKLDEHDYSDHVFVERECYGLKVVTANVAKSLFRTRERTLQQFDDNSEKLFLHALLEANHISIGPGKDGAEGMIDTDAHLQRIATAVNDADVVCFQEWLPGSEGARVLMNAMDGFTFLHHTVKCTYDKIIVEKDGRQTKKTIKSEDTVCIATKNRKSVKKKTGRTLDHPCAPYMMVKVDDVVVMNLHVPNPGQASNEWKKKAKWRSDGSHMDHQYLWLNTWLDHTKLVQRGTKLIVAGDFNDVTENYAQQQKEYTPINASQRLSTQNPAKPEPYRRWWSRPVQSLEVSETRDNRGDLVV